MGNGNIPRRNKSVKSALRSMRRDGSMSANDQKSATVKHMKEIEEAENDMRKYRQRGQAILAASIAAAFADSDIRGYLNRQITNPEILTVIEPARALRFEFNQSFWRP